MSTKMTFSGVLTTLALVLACANPVAAGTAPTKSAGLGDDPQAKFDATQLIALYNKIKLVVVGPQDPKDPNSLQSFFGMRAIGLSIPPGFGLSTSDLDMLDQQFDFIPQFSKVYYPSGFRYSDIYGHIINDKTLLNNPVLTDAQKKQEKALHDKLDPTGDYWKNYVAAKIAYISAGNDLRTAKANIGSLSLAVTSDNNTIGILTTKINDAIKKNNMTDAKSDGDLLAILKGNLASDQAALLAANNAKSLAQANFDTAGEQFGTGGNATQVESELETLFNLQALDGKAYWLSLQNAWKAGHVTQGGDFYQLNFFPDPSTWYPAGSDPGAPMVWPPLPTVTLPMAVDTSGKARMAKKISSRGKGRDAVASDSGDGSGDSTSTDGSTGSNDGSTGSTDPSTGSTDPSTGSTDPSTGSTDQSTGVAAKAIAGVLGNGSGQSIPGIAAPGTPPPAAVSGGMNTAAGGADGSAAAGAGGMNAAMAASALANANADPSWTTVTFTSDDYSSNYDSSASASSMSANFSCGLVSGGASASNNKALQAVNMNDKSFSLSFDIKLVSVFRPWFDMTVLSNSTWTIAKAQQIFSPGAPISYGLTDPLVQMTPKALMPLYLNTLVLVRNLTIRSADLSTQLSQMQSASAAGATCSYGPFGNVSASTQSADQNGSSAGKKKQFQLVSKGVQIIGVVSGIVPVCPLNKAIK